MALSRTLVVWLLLYKRKWLKALFYIHTYEQQKSPPITSGGFFVINLSVVDYFFLGAVPVVPKQKAMLPGSTIPHSVPSVSGVPGTNL